MDELIAAALPFRGVALALALGLLIGIERGWSRRLEADGSRVAGIRTFALLGLLGGMAGEMGRQMSPWMAAVLVAAAAAALAIGYWRTTRQGEDLSATTAIVGIITLGIGVFAATGHGVLASGLAAVTTLILSLRRQLHTWLEEMSEPELHAIARFGLISLAILPVLPDMAYGPYDAWNPRQIWMVVVFVSGLSLAGYAATKRLGASRGILATAAAGAVVSSTAVTAALAARLRSGDAPAATLGAGIALASAVMFVRVLILVAVLAPFALLPLLAVVGPASLLSVGWAVWRLRRPAEDRGPVTVSPPLLRNPFDLAPALLLALLVMGLSLLSRWVLTLFGDAGLATVLALSGMVDVDSAVLTVSGLPRGSLSPMTAGLVFAAPMLMNTLVKAGLTVESGGGRAGWAAAAPLILSVGVALASLPLLPVLFG